MEARINVPLASSRASKKSKMWHPDIPFLQLSWDATSFKELMACPRRYYFSTVLGFKTKKDSFHLKFGKFYHEALAAYDWARLNKANWEEAQEYAIAKALEITYGWDSEDKAKNRFSLWRTVQWYTEKFRMDDPVKICIDKNGKPLNELNFLMQIPLHPDIDHNSDYFFCGYFDGIVEYAGMTFIQERKTTGSTLSKKYFTQFKVDCQIDLYSLASSIVYYKDVQGVLIDAAQVVINFSRFARVESLRTPEQLDEAMNELMGWIKVAERYAMNRVYPRATRFCFMCPFLDVCAVPPASRGGILKSDFIVEDWDPTVERREG